MIPALVLACTLAPAECHSHDATRIASAIDLATTDDLERARLVVYSHEESHWTERPAPVSHDARDGTSCGYLQMRCDRVRGHSLAAQARMWLSDVRASSLGDVDSSPSRAFARDVVAVRLLVGE